MGCCDHPDLPVKDLNKMKQFSSRVSTNPDQFDAKMAAC